MRKKFSLGEVKKRYKLYKSGKRWLVAATVFIGLLGLGSVSQADEISTTQTQESAITAVEGTFDSESDSDVSDVPITEGENPQPSEDEIANANGGNIIQPSEQFQQEQEARAYQSRAVDQLPIYQAYNPNSGEHFFTQSKAEKDGLVKAGWKDEGVTMYGSSSGNAVYRVYNPNTGEHHYTTSSSEKNGLVKAGWRDEGTSWYAPYDGAAVYRLLNPNAKGIGSHYYTTNTSERKWLMDSGWKSESIAWFSVGSRSKVDKLVDWFYVRQDIGITYSMLIPQRNGPKQYDCSSAVYSALIEAGYLPPGTTLGNTSTLSWLNGSVLTEISRSEVRKGDIFISGDQGNSNGAAGHTGVASSNTTIVHCNGADNGISETQIEGRTGPTPTKWYRLK
ncbi:peptidoglycan amidohydrolase family protein [Enterococcus sp. AZ103]|uniref:peptidoglycan amidohydrolase family protein n=1 Tax=Enterococcus sp. AZ103 TaxID=2774628 RepID=UPI003F20741D